MASNPLVEWSPDGRWIAYGADGELWIVQPDAGPPRNLVQNNAGLIAWSPDSGAIAYTERGALAVDVVDVDTGVQRVTAQGLSCYPPKWSPDSTRLTCVAPSDPDFGWGELAVVDARTGKITTLTRTEPEPRRIVVETRTRGGKLQSSFNAPQDLRGLAWGESRFALLIGQTRTRAMIEIRSAKGKLLRDLNVPRPALEARSAEEARQIVERVDCTTLYGGMIGLTVSESPPSQ